ncbi:MAG: DUF1501 domain-containing protein [Blastocatellia bacterium]
MNNHLHPGHVCDVCRPLKPANRPLFGPEIGRRSFFKLAGAGVSGYFLSPLAGQLANAETVTAATDPFVQGTARNVILIMLMGAPSQIDTFDLKVGAWTPADFNPTSYNGVMFPQGLLPTLATHMDKMAIIRSVRAPALVHQLQQIWVQISRNPTSALGRIAPHIGSIMSLEMEKQRRDDQKLPGFISLNTGGNVNTAGYLSARYSPFDTTAAAAGLTSLVNADGKATFETRYKILTEMDAPLRANAAFGRQVEDVDGFYQQSRDMMYNTEVDNVFKFAAADQTRYGNTGFGNSCIVARNLVKADMGTRFIQINLGGWDNHDDIYLKRNANNNLAGIYGPSLQLDLGLGNLLTDLAALPGSRGGTLLDETLIVTMGEFGRTVKVANNSTVSGINNTRGRDHWFQQFAMFAGGGVEGGKVVGVTSADAYNVVEPGWSQNRAVANEDIAATIYSAVGIDYTTKRYDDPFRRGYEYVPFASEGAWYPVKELFANRDRARGTGPNRPATPSSPEGRGRGRGVN